MNDNFIIPLNGLAVGKNEFFIRAGKDFFESFENDEILDADLQIRILVEKSGRYVGVDCDVEGTITVECDRCLDPLEMPVDEQVRLSVKFGEEENAETGQDSEREVVFVKEDDAELDMSQIVYDYACLALPMQRMHEEGGCNPDVMKYYGGVEEDVDAGVAESPFAALKDLF
ncbi:MAG: hypothetical protein E7123_01855 [Bacteroidales bacterium]|nr:hypothetical protein [Bacteroidales bacterium]